MITTTLADIRAAGPCEDGFAKIRDHFGASAKDAKTHREPFPVSLLLETNDLSDTLWVVDNVIGNKRLCRLFAADCAERVLHIFEDAHPNDDRPRQAIAVARNPDATNQERAAAGAAARAAAGAAWAAAGDAAGAAARAAWAAAGDAAWAAAGDAAGAAARAAGDAAWAAARAAAGAAARAAAWAAARGEQTARLRQYLEHGEAAAQMPWPQLEAAE